ncbi:hypothetical protein MNBD_GAMMA12-62 [hydrothermal vent metagenome]|uniref:Uncharacterized protein n=1 Tax=hydrothermal vent metagenome TaxID=652676 RepID=A0A3B0YFZ1_9ZZZZ
MKYINNIKIRILLVGCLIAVSGTVHAVVTVVTGNTSNRNIAVGQTSSKTITWTVTMGTATPGPFITSAGVAFYANTPSGALLGTSLKILTRTVPGPGTYVLIDNITIPSSIVYSASKQGVSRIAVVRNFTDNVGSANGFANLDITGSGASGFTINAVSVRFDNNQPQRVIKRLQQHKAYIKLTYSGSGLLRGLWEIATPSSTIGQAVYRPLRVVRKHLPGTGIYKLYSPRLPTQTQGVYLVRFRITAPAVSFSDPLIRYFVYSGKKPRLSPVSVFLHQPGPSTALNNKTVFRWNKISQASALRLEFYAVKKNSSLNLGLPSLGQSDDQTSQIKGPLVAGKLLKGSTQKTNISTLTLARLKPGHWYLWRLVVFNKEGNIIGVSKPRKVYSPAK